VPDSSDAGAPDEPLLDADTVRALERLSLVSLDAVVAGFAGQRAGRAGGTGLEFADYRPYAVGDDLRRIDWNVFVRLRELLVKLGPEEGHIEIDLLIDSSGSMGVGPQSKLRYARRVAAALGAVGLLRADAVRAWALSDGEAEPGARLDGRPMLALLEREIDRLGTGRATDLPASLHSYRGTGAAADLAVLLSDALVRPASLAQALDELASAAPSTALVHVIDGADAARPPGGAVVLRDRETGRRLELALTPSVSAAYEERFERFRSAVEGACADAGVRYVPAPTDASVLDLLSESARLAGLVRV